MLSLFAPLGLLALLALAIPLLLHLIRRPDEQIHDFAALRWLIPKTPRPRRRWRQRLLLALRLVGLALLAALLCEPVLRGGWNHGPAWAVVAPGVSLDAARAALGKDSAELHALAPGFPLFNGGAPDSRDAPASLIRELSVTTPRERALIVIVPDTLRGLDAERLQLGRAIDWRIAAGSSPQGEHPASAAAVTPIVDKAIPAGPDHPLTNWLLPLIAVLFAAERLLALRGGSR